VRPARLLPASLAAAFLCSIGGLQAPGAEDVIVLGATLSLSGKYAQDGANTKNGYELAVRKINDKGGVKIGGKSYRLALRYYNDESTPSRGMELAERLIKQDSVKFMLGPSGLGLTKAILPVVEKYKVPMIEADADARELYARDRRYLFAVASASEQYLTPVIELAVEYAGALGKSKERLKVALAMERDSLAREIRAGVLAAVTRHGMKVVIDDQLSPELNDMSVTLTKVQTLRPDLLLISGQEQGALTAVTQIEALKIDVPILAMTHCDSAQLVEKLGDAAENVFCAHQWHRSLGYKDALFGAAEDFARHFEQTYKYAAPHQAASSAAAVHVFADALARAKSLDPEAVRDAIAETELETFYGPVKFDAAGRNIAKPMVVTQIQGGEYVVVAPAALAKGEPIVPRPLR
jgi:branched-chain amino acid transport system substrate-binding protein